MKQIWLIAVVCFVGLISSCGNDENPSDNNNNKSIASCEGCHVDYTTLKAIAAPDTSSGGGGCGGEAPHYETYDKVHLGGTGFTEFKASAHGKMACTDCHNGTDKTDDKSVAHSGSFIGQPSLFYEDKCKSCHNDIVSRYKNSIHEMGWGQKRKVTIRSGLSGSQDFDKLPAHQIEGYKKNCATCHASCGDCHVNRPHAGGGGLAAGHKFAKEPDMVEVCVTCHKSRGGHAYLGVAPGTQPDVHLTKMGFKCMDCHKETDVHGDGKTYEQRYQITSQHECTECHSGLENKNTYHAMHYSTFSCNTCHSQNYNNCGSCHIGGQGARITSYNDFKIGMNPIPDIKKKYKFAVLRRTLMAPDSWEIFGVPALANFDAFPIFNYSTPHNILKWTERTKVDAGKTCSDNCHIVKEGDTYRNKKYYLFMSDLQFPWEVSSSSAITVDGKLPKSWGL
jgi:thiosulfate/3-mercaptopyruvate sulfurtransferase